MVNTNCAHSQNKDEQIISMLKEYYIAHSDIWDSKQPLSLNEFDSKLDALQSKYCTSKLISESKKYLEQGYDLLTNDLGIDKETLKSSLTIVKDTKKEGNYVVSYIIQMADSPTLRKKKNTIHLIVVKEEGRYKIDQVW